jgi:hypothetical protein
MPWLGCNPSGQLVISGHLGTQVAEVSMEARNFNNRTVTKIIEEWYEKNIIIATAHEMWPDDVASDIHSSAFVLQS